MARVLGEKFFNRSAVEVAPDLLGKFLVRQQGGEMMRYRIVETEAYEGPDDAANHASRGRTARTEVMFGPPGRWYVYFVYGMYEMLNVVTGPEGHPGAVLIRAVKLNATHIDGPGKLMRELKITRALNTKKALPDSGLWIEYAPPVLPKAIETTPRIGVAYAGEWAHKPWRFVLKY